MTGSGLEERVYAQHDSQFSVISITDGSGTVIQRIAYDPYGTPTLLTASWAYDTNHGGTNYWIVYFQGMTLVADGTSGNMLQSQRRLYDVKLGRWISQDQAGYINGGNKYQYETSNPLAFTDATGDSITVVNQGAIGTIDIEDYLTQGHAIFGSTEFSPHYVPAKPDAESFFSIPDCACPSGYRVVCILGRDLTPRFDITVSTENLMMSPATVATLRSKGKDIGQIQELMNEFNSATVAHEQEHVQNELNIWGSDIITFGFGSACSNSPWRN